MPSSKQETETVTVVLKDLPDPSKLRLLADWFDSQDEAGRFLSGDTEVQDDLRAWASNIASAVPASQEVQGLSGAGEELAKRWEDSSPFSRNEIGRRRAEDARSHAKQLRAFLRNLAAPPPSSSGSEES